MEDIPWKSSTSISSSAPADTPHKNQESQDAKIKTHLLTYVYKFADRGRGNHLE